MNSLRGHEKTGRGTREPNIHCGYGCGLYIVIVGAMLHEGTGRAICRVDSGPEEPESCVPRPIYRLTSFYGLTLQSPNISSGFL